MPCPILPVPRPVSAAATPPVARKRSPRARSGSHPAPERARQCPRFRKTRPRYRTRPLSGPSPCAGSPARATRPPQAGPSCSTMPSPLDDNMRPVRGVLAALPSAGGPEMAGNPFLDIVNPPAADGAVSPGKGRSAKRRTRASGLTRGRRWRSPQPLLPEPQVHLRQPSLGLYTAALTVAAASGVLGTSSRTSSGRR